MTTNSKQYASYGTYIRNSTAKQETEHQYDDIEDWFEQRDMSLADAEMYVDEARSGADDSRSDFLRLIEDIESSEIDNVVIWEISRIARKGVLAQRFFDSCEENGVTIHVANGSVRTIEPDGHGRLIADIIAAVAAEERRSLIRRTEAGLRRARKEGKWLGQVPAGFVRSDDGYLKPNLDPNYDDGETGYFDVADALENIDSGMSYREAAKRTPNITRPTLMNIHKGDRCGWYSSNPRRVDNDQVKEAIEDISVGESDE